MTANAKTASRRGLVAWCLYDWANSSFPTVIVTFVFAAYFTKAVAADPVAGTAQWGYALSLSALFVALFGPVLGAAADHGGRRKPWLAAFTVLAVAATALLWFIEPGPAMALAALVLVGVANFAFEMGTVFYNAMLPGLAAAGRLGRLSGWGWGLGYAGGLAALALVLAGLVEPETPWFGLSRQGSENIRAAAPLVAVWWAVFSLPLFIFTPDRGSSGLCLATSVRRGLASLGRTLRNIRAYGNIGRFLLARMIYIDGLNTLFAFGGIYAAGAFGMDYGELIIFGIAMNVTAGLGALGFAWVDDIIGSKRTIVIAVAGLAVLGGGLLVVEGKTLFWVFALPLGLFIGPAQAASRSMVARLAPPEMRTEIFGLFALSGKATAFLGPALLAFVTETFNSQRAGMAVILVFFGLGLALLLPVVEPEH